MEVKNHQLIRKSSYLEADKQKLYQNLKQLELQVTKINQISEILEEAIWEFQAIAAQVNQNQYLLTSKQKPICAYYETKIPSVQQKPNGCLVLTSRPLSFFKAEKEAHSLAHKLRQRAKRKQQRGTYLSK